MTIYITIPKEELEDFAADYLTLVDEVFAPVVENETRYLTGSQRITEEQKETLAAAYANATFSETWPVGW